MRLLCRQAGAGHDRAKHPIAYGEQIPYKGPRLRAYLERTPEGERIQTAVPNQ